MPDAATVRGPASPAARASRARVAVAFAVFKFKLGWSDEKKLHRRRGKSAGPILGDSEAPAKESHAPLSESTKAPSFWRRRKLAYGMDPGARGQFADVTGAMAGRHAVSPQAPSLADAPLVALGPAGSLSEARPDLGRPGARAAPEPEPESGTMQRAPTTPLALSGAAPKVVDRHWHRQPVRGGRLRREH